MYSAAPRGRTRNDESDMCRFQYDDDNESWCYHHDDNGRWYYY